jgi:heat-inducible transcriptional repressor
MVRHVEVLSVGERRLMLVVITDSGRVEQRLVETVADIDDDLIGRLRVLLADHVAGRSSGDTAVVLADLADSAAPGDRDVVTGVAAVLRDALIDHPEERLVLSGTGNITGAWADQPATLRGVLDALDEQVTLLKLLAALDEPDALRVSIGEENADSNLASSALVSVGYGAGEVLMGGLAVVGPTRMDYPGTMATVRAVARYVGEIVGGR